MKGGEPLTVREASFISLLMGHAERTDAATVRFTMHLDGSLDGQINLMSQYTRTHETETPRPPPQSPNPLAPLPPSGGPN